MRAALALAVALLLASPASADVLVARGPDRAPRRRRRQRRRRRDRVRASRRRDRVRGRAARRRWPGVGPGVAAAPDGTAVLAAVSRRSTLSARIRRPGRGFAQPVRLGGPAGVYALAAAPGGWAAVAWQRRDGHGIEAAVIDPAGAVRRAQLDHAGGTFSAPVVGIDAAGRATVAWTRYRRGERQRVRVARGGPRWSRGRDVERAGRAPADPQWPQAGLAVTAAGHSLLAWAAPRGVRVSLDGAAPRTLARARSPGPPFAALAEDGSAVIAYAAASQVFAVDRAQAGPWSAPHRLSGDPSASAGGPAAERTQRERAQRRDEPRSAPTAARWSRGRPTAPPSRRDAPAARGRRRRTSSSPVRLADWPPDVALDQAGGPFVLWSEYEQSTLTDRIHGARLVPEAQAPPPDTTAPTLTTRLPESVEVAQDGAFSFSSPSPATRPATSASLAVTDARPTDPASTSGSSRSRPAARPRSGSRPRIYDERRFVKRAQPDAPAHRRRGRRPRRQRRDRRGHGASPAPLSDFDTVRRVTAQPAQAVAETETRRRRAAIVAVDDEPGRAGRGGARPPPPASASSTGSCAPTRATRRSSALKELVARGEQVALLVADQRMPGMAGTEYLVQARKLVPDAKRVLLTAYADTEAAIPAINEVDLDYYLLKPWDPPEERPVPGRRGPADHVGGRRGARGRRRARARPPLLARLARPARLPRPQPRPRPLARHRARQRGARAAARGRRRATRGSPSPCSRTARCWSGPTVLELAERLGVSAQPVDRPLRPRDRRRRPGRPRRRGLRRVRGPADRDGRARGAGRPGRHVEPDRELPRLPRRPLRLRPRAPRDRPGTPARRRAAHRPGRGQLHVEGAGRLVELRGGGTLSANCVLVASGVSYRQLDCPGFDELNGAGIYYGAALSEARACEDQHVVVIGGANSAGQAAVYFAAYAEPRDDARARRARSPSRCRTT